MFRLILAVTAFAGSVLTASAQTKSFIPQAPPIEVRMTSAESKIAELEKEIAALKAKTFGVPQPMPKTPTVSVPPVSFSGVVPAGMHAHQKADGTVVVHGNQNYGNSAAHAGMAYPYYRTAEAGQVIPVQITASPTAAYRKAFSGDGCPAGGCPASSQKYAPFGGFFRR